MFPTQMSGTWSLHCKMSKIVYEMSNPAASLAVEQVQRGIFRRDQMDEHCKNCEERHACIPFFDHENTMMHYSNANKRMLIALIVVCCTFIATIIIFVRGYTIREKNWLDTLNRITVTEVGNGVQQQQNQGTNP